MIPTTTKPFITSVFSICLVLVASLASAGYYYESVMDRTVAGQRNSSHTQTRGWVDGPKARIEFTSGEKKGFFADGNYLVTTDAGENVFLVNPEDETYAPFNLDDMMATLGAAMSMMEEMGGLVKMEVTDTSSEMVLEEPGENILGHSTMHYQYKSGYTMNLSVMGMKQENRNDSVTDIWSTSELEALGFGVWLRPDRQMKTGNEGLDSMLGQQFNQIQGLPLRMVMETTTTNKKGREQNSTTTIEVTALRDEVVSDDMFTWPDHYTETEVLPTDIDQGIQQQLEDAKKKKKEEDKKKKKKDKD